VELLLHKYEKLTQDSISDTEKHRKTLVHLLHLWLDVYPEDWDISNLENLIVFSSKNLPNSELHLKALTRLDQLTATRGPATSQWFPYHPFYDFTSCNEQLLPDQFSDICLNPAFRGPGGHLLNTYRFPNINVKHFAEQLTRMDMTLFKRLIPHQCLGSTWSKRENDKAECRTVLATVNQFNAVSFRVISSILIEPKLKHQERALLIQTWVDIAQELRLLKNFSSLKAIISGLQSNPVYRLNKTWAALQKEKMELFNELARIFSEENNASTQREILMREGTAKYATSGENDRHLQKAIQKQNTYTCQVGTIPYLGTFLTDLTYIHAAIPNNTLDGLINFDKKRKEFELLAQIKLLQGSANIYKISEDPMFDRWFASLLILDEREAHQISCQLEPLQENAKNKAASLSNNNNNSSSSNGSSNHQPPQLQHGPIGHRKSDSIASNSSGGSQFYCDITTMTFSSQKWVNFGFSISIYGNCFFQLSK
jgi:ral guanine nucleotide dissociation stimulator-like 1